MNESDFALEIKHSIQKQLENCHYKKIPDQIFNPSAWNARFNPEKDYDSYVIYNGCFTAMEYKLWKSSNAFPLNKVTLIQRSALLEVKESGGNAYIIIGIRYNNIRKAFMIDIKDFLEFCYNHERKSMPINALEQYPEIPWRGKGIWGLNKYLFIYGGKNEINGRNL